MCQKYTKSIKHENLATFLADLCLIFEKMYFVKSCKLFFALIAAIGFSIAGSAQVVINEICIANYSDYALPAGGNNFEDWIEFYNPTGVAVDISGYWLSDNLNNPQKWSFPAGTTIPANGYRLVLLTGRGDYQPGYLGGLNANFKINQTGGEEIVFSNAGGLVLESYDFGADADFLLPNQANHSWSRMPDGSSNWKIQTDPTPLAAVAAAGSALAYADKPLLDLEAGYYAGPINVTITTAEPGATIYYTTNGNTPSNTSTLYTGPIPISTTTVLRAIVYSSDPNRLPSFIETNTYFFGNDTHGMLTVSVSGNNMNGQWPGGGNNRLTNIEFFTAGGTFITENHGDSNEHGNDSNAYGQRGFDYIGRDELGYDHTVEEPLFAHRDRQDYDRLIFKAAANDNYPFSNGGAHIRDAYVCELSILGGLHVDERATRNCIVYLNGQYWGVYEVREKIDDTDFTEHYYDQSRGQVDYLKTWGGTWAEYDAAPAFNAQGNWNNLQNFIVGNSMAVQANYDYVETQFNTMSLIDYFILNGYTVCTDWLNWNTQWWRGYNPNGDARRWRYALWDNDATFGHYVNYTGVASTGPDADPCQIDSEGDIGGQGHIPILNALFDNPDFTADYIQRYAELSNEIFSCEKMLQVLDSMIAAIEPEMPRQITRWGGTMAGWQNNVLDLRNYILARCPEETSSNDIVEGLEDCYDVTQQILTVQISGPGSVILEESEISVPAPPALYVPYTGTYFSGNTAPMPIDIEAVADGTGVCSEFIQWVVVSGTATFADPLNPITTLVIESDAVIEAQFGTGNTGNVITTLDVSPAGSASISWNGVSNSVMPSPQTELAGTNVAVEVLPNTGFVFDHWESNTTAILPSDMDVLIDIVPCIDDDLVAVLLPVYDVVVNVVGNGDANINGQPLSNGNFSFLATDVINLAALENGPCGQLISWEIVSGTGVLSNSSVLNPTLTISSDVVINVNFTALPPSSVNVVFNSVYPDAGGIIFNGTTLTGFPQTLTVTPGVDLSFEVWSQEWYDFTNWIPTNYTLTPNNSATIVNTVVCGAEDIEVVFDFTPHALVTIDKAPAYIGQVFLDGVELPVLPVTYDWAIGENHSIGALTLVQWTAFDHWESLGTALSPNATASTISITVSQEDSIKAFFVEIPHSLITVLLDAPYSGRITSSNGGSSDYMIQFETAHGVPVQFGVQENEFYDFTHWSSAQLNTISPGAEEKEIEMVFFAPDTVVAHIKEEIYNCYIPNSFTPNGDNINDCLEPVGNALDIERYALTIFNRHGEIVFETKDFDKCWDGSLRGNGYYVPSDIYHYELIVKSVFDKEAQKKVGTVLVVR
jgi:gliding motility-associated-like protein